VEADVRDSEKDFVCDSGTAPNLEIGLTNCWLHCTTGKVGPTILLATGFLCGWFVDMEFSAGLRPRDRDAG